MERQAVNVLSVLVFGCISGDAKVGFLGKTTHTGPPLIGLRAATLLKGMVTICGPADADSENGFIYTDQAAGLQAQYDRLLRFQASIGNVVTPDVGFMLPGFCTGPTARFQLQLGPLYSKRPGKLSDTPTIATSPRKEREKKRKLAEVEEASISTQQVPTASTREGLICQQEVEVPYPVPGVTTYNPTLMPGFQPGVFESPNDMVANQLNVRDIDDTLVRPWALHTVLVDGALVTARVNLVAWVIREKVMCHLVAEDINVYHRPGQPSCAIIRAPPSSGSEPGPSSSASALAALHSHIHDSTSQPGSSSGGGGNKHAKGNDGGRMLKTGGREKGKGKGKEKEKEKEKDLMLDADWEGMD